MAKLLFKLNGVPADEAQEIRILLEENGIGFYETSIGNWGISLAAIWLKDENQLDLAKQLIDAYQSNRLVQARAENKESMRTGQRKTTLDFFKEQPLKFVLHIIIALGLLYLSVKPFVDFGR